MHILIGNWKMAPEKPSQAAELAKKTLALARLYKKTVALGICVPSAHLMAVAKVIKAPLGFGAQLVSGSSEIARTGEVNAAMLRAYGAGYCLAGHSEARARGETNEAVKEQVARLLEKKLRPILCVGEKARDAHGWYLSEVKDQIESALAAVPKASLKQVLVAYEPVWAIGKNAEREATPSECREMIIFIRKIISDMHGEKAAAVVSILYGGSVDEKNAAAFLSEGGANGLLVGRVSLEPKRFAQLAKSIS